MWNVACVYANEKAPKDISATFQSLVDGGIYLTIYLSIYLITYYLLGIHWGLGSGLGSLLGGYYYEVYGAVELFQSCKILNTYLLTIY